MFGFPTLYKKTSTGAIQYWDIRVEDRTIITTYGQVNGKQQETRDTIEDGKNIGRSNATTATEQAQAEAQAKWEKQIKKGYVQEIDRAKADETDVTGGFNVMLAHSFAKHGHKIKYPAYMQPKLDGIRCAATGEEGNFSLWSRTRKPVTGVPHIIKALELLFPTGSYCIDGELYNHKFKSNFEQIVSYVRQEEPAEGHEIVEYHIYDCFNDQTFWKRYGSIITQINDKYGASVLQAVPTMVARDEKEAVELFNEFVSRGYEGAIIRNEMGLYVGKRSYDLQKIKEFDDAEFKIVGIEEGRGKLKGHVGAFICETVSGQRFEAKMAGDTSKLREYFEDVGGMSWRDKLLTVKYQGITNKNGVPRFPVGLRIRDGAL